MERYEMLHNLAPMVDISGVATNPLPPAKMVKVEDAINKMNGIEKKKLFCKKCGQQLVPVGDPKVTRYDMDSGHPSFLQKVACPNKRWHNMHSTAMFQKETIGEWKRYHREHWYDHWD